MSGYKNGWSTLCTTDKIIIYQDCVNGICNLDFGLSYSVSASTKR